MRNLGLLCAVVVGAAMAAAGTPAFADWAQDKEACSDDHRPEEWIRVCTSAIESGRLSKKELAVALFNRGTAWKVKGDPDKAIQDYDEALKIQPKDGLLLLYRGTAWVLKGDYDRAIADFDQAISVGTLQYVAHADRGGAWLGKGDYERGMADLDVSLRMNPQYAVAYASRCWARATRGIELDRAMSDCDKAVHFTRNAPEMFEMRGFVSFRRSDFNGAVADETKATALDASRPNALYTRGLAELRLGRQTEGQADISAAQQLDPQVDDRFKSWGVTP